MCSNTLSYRMMDESQVDAAVDALMKHCRAQESFSLTDTDARVSIQVVFNHVPHKTKHPIKITLKHAMYSKAPAVCLITKDPQRYYKDLVKSNNLSVSKVIGVGKLKKKFKDLEAKRILCDSHDVFLVDERVLPIVPRWFGSYFYRKGKSPIKVDLTQKDIKRDIEIGMRSVMVANLGKGSNLSILCGKVSFDNEVLSENIHSAVASLSSYVKWKNIRAVYVKTESSIALPVYTAFTNNALKIKD